MHGLDSVGLAPGGAVRLHRHVARQLRLLSKSPSYITHETSTDLLARLRIPDRVSTLCQRVQQCLKLCREGPMATLQPAQVHRWWQQLDLNFSSAQADPHQHQHTTASLRVPTRLVALSQKVDPQPCPVFGSYFSNMRILRIHIALKHKPSATAPAAKPQRRLQSDMRRD